MRRSELYEMVWSKPMTKLAKELGISDVGLAKACRRHSVPAPPRGYWAKLHAGQNPPRTRLPSPEQDVEVHFVTTDPEERSRQVEVKERRKEAVKSRVEEALTTAEVTFPDQLEKPHPLVSATRRYCEKVPRLVERYNKRRNAGTWHRVTDEERPPYEQHGRYSFFREGQLDIKASLDVMDWVLRFHDVVLKALTAGGMKIQWCPRQEGRGHHRQEESAHVQLSQSGETFKLEFSQGYRRTAVDPAELAKRRKSESWASAFEHHPSEKLSFRVIGTEYGARKTWEGNRDKLQRQVSDIVRTIFELVPLQTELRAQREAEAKRARHQAEIAAARRRHQEARAEQLKRAFEMAGLDEKVRGLEAFLVNLEERLTSTSDETARERCSVWIQVVREELARSLPIEILIKETTTVPSWRSWPPDWWPVNEGEEVGASDDE